MRGIALVGLASLLLGCPGSKKNTPRVPEGGGGEPGIFIGELERELESSVLEILGQLTLGNIETYADGLRRGKPVTLIGAEVGATFVGDGRETVELERWPLLEDQPEFLSKNLDVRVSARGEIGWSYDEVSLRVLVDGKLASLPLRLTLVFTRDVDRWVVALDHWSFPVPAADIAYAARAGKSVETTKLTTMRDSPFADTLIQLVGQLENGDTRVREQRLSRDKGSLVVLPGVDEYRGALIDSSPTLTEIFEGARTVGLRDYRVESSASGDVAWMAANLVVRGGVAESFEIRLRASYVFEHSKSGWKVVHSHISVPVPRGFFEELLGN